MPCGELREGLRDSLLIRCLAIGLPICAWVWLGSTVLTLLSSPPTVSLYMMVGLAGAMTLLFTPLLIPLVQVCLEAPATAPAAAPAARAPQLAATFDVENPLRR